MSLRAARALRRLTLTVLPLGLLACASLISLEDGELAATGGAAGTTSGGAGGGGGAGSGGVSGSSGGGGSAGAAGTGGGGTGATGGSAGADGGTGATGGSGGTAAGGTSGAGGTGGTGGGSGGTGATGGTGGVTGSKYANEVLADAPIAYWRLDEAAGATSVADASGNGHTGTPTNTKLVFGKPGVSNTAVQFDGTGYLDFGDKFSFDGTAAMTVEGWFQPIGEGCGFVGKGDYVTGYDGWFLAEGSGVLQAVRGTAVQTAPKVSQTKFTHVVMTYDGTTHALYVDGALVKSSASLTTVNKHAHSFRIGNVYQWKSFTGWIDEVALYDKALSAGRIAAHFNAAK